MVVVKSGPGIRGLLAVPHGVLSIVPMIVAPVALSLNLIATLTCNFLEQITERTRYTGAVFNEDGNVTHVDVDLSRNRDTYGLRYFQCEENPANFEFNYPYGSLGGLDELTDDEVDENPFNPFTDPDYSVQTEDKFRSAIAFGFISVLIGGMTMLFLHLATCISYHKLVLKLMGLGFTLASLFALMMLIVFSAELCDEGCVDDLRNRTRVEELELDIPLDNICNQGCRVGPGAGMALGAGILWFVTAFVTCLLQTDNEDDDDDKDTADPGDQQNSERAPLNQEPEVVYQYEDESGNIHEGSPPVAPPRRTSGPDEGLPPQAVGPGPEEAHF